LRTAFPRILTVTRFAYQAVLSGSFVTGGVLRAASGIYQTQYSQRSASPTHSTQETLPCFPISPRNASRANPLKVVSGANGYVVQFLIDCTSLKTTLPRPFNILLRQLSFQQITQEKILLESSFPSLLLSSDSLESRSSIGIHLLTS